MNKKIILLTNLFLALVISSVSPNLFAKVAKANPNNTMPKQILFYVNQYRLQHHLAPLQMNAVINTEATIHSQEMASHRIPFGHQGFTKRIKRIYAKLDNANGGAENVAYNYKNAEIVVREWVKSPGHRRNIVGHYNLTGIGIAYDKKGKIYFTQIFIKTR